MPFVHHPSSKATRAVRDVSRVPFWLDSSQRPAPADSLTAQISADLVIVGAGFTGLWAAVAALEEQPGRSVVVLDAGTAGWAASGRNGGFLAASLTHGIANGLKRWPHDMPEILWAGMRNLDDIEKAVANYGIDCDWHRDGEITVATEQYQIADLKHEAQIAQDYGLNVQWMEGEEVRSVVNSPTYRAASWNREGIAMIDPAKLVWGLRSVAAAAGAQFFENTNVTDVQDTGSGIDLRTDHGGVVHAKQVLLATNVFPGLIPEIRRRVVPVHDYVIMSEPLTEEQHARIGWTTRAGVGDSGNQFHYYRMTADRRILFGGYDAIYKFGGRFNPAHDENPTSWARLADHFWQTFPQLDDVSFSHAWGGAIDTCTRFAAFWGTKFDGRLAYVTGYTGLGVGASRFGALTALDLLAGRSSERTRFDMVNTKPMPWPTEPVRWLGIQLTRMSLDRADRRQGRRNLWLRGLDAAGLGFDS